MQNEFRKILFLYRFRCWYMGGYTGIYRLFCRQQQGKDDRNEQAVEHIHNNRVYSFGNNICILAKKKTKSYNLNNACVLLLTSIYIQNILGLQAETCLWKACGSVRKLKG